MPEIGKKLHIGGKDFIVRGLEEVDGRLRLELEPGLHEIGSYDVCASSDGSLQTVTVSLEANRGTNHRPIRLERAGSVDHFSRAEAYALAELLRKAADNAPIPPAEAGDYSGIKVFSRKGHGGS